jgi:hypothetical protein
MSARSVAAANAGQVSHRNTRSAVLAQAVQLDGEHRNQHVRRAYSTGRSQCAESVTLPANSSATTFHLRVPALAQWQQHAMILALRRSRVVRRILELVHQVGQRHSTRVLLTSDHPRTQPGDTPASGAPTSMRMMAGGNCAKPGGSGAPVGSGFMLPP